MIRNKGVCCIVLALEENDPPLKFRTMTYKRFSSLHRDEALTKLGDVILNNLLVTEKAIEYCGIHRHNYRLSSDIFPLMTYDKAHISFSELPQVDEIFQSMDSIKMTRLYHNVRLSSHPDQFNVLASPNSDAVDRTIRELEFQGKFMTWIGCSLDYNSPINIHVNRSAQSDDARKSVRDLFYKNFERLSDNVKKRLVLENDDKAAGWTVAELFDYFDRPEIPITFDYLHHKCHPGAGYFAQEAQAFLLAHDTWRARAHITPLFHYSESIPGNKNPRKHSDYATTLPDTYGQTIDLDFEFKMKEKSFQNL
jgi:UV DNA damage endonuclease